MSWRDFERLIAEAFRAQGYSVIENEGTGADGGIDVRLSRGGETTIVQCKHYQRSSVGVAVIREMFGVQTSEGFDACMVVTSGTFTRDAKDFAEKNGIRLYDSKGLMALTGGVSNSVTPVPADKPITTEPVHVDRSAPLSCPSCGSDMTLRTARKGAHAGSRFYGCSTYPKCRGTRSV